MKLSPDQYDWSKKLKRVKVKDAASAKALASIANGEKHVVLRAEDGTEVVAMSLEEYEGLMETLDILSDEDATAAIKEGMEDLKAGRVYTHEEVFGHPWAKLQGSSCAARHQLVQPLVPSPSSSG